MAVLSLSLQLVRAAVYMYSLTYLLDFFGDKAVNSCGVLSACRVNELELYALPWFCCCFHVVGFGVSYEIRDFSASKYAVLGVKRLLSHWSAKL